MDKRQKLKAVMEGHFFDLDYTLWETDGKVWLIDKNNPSTFLKKLTKNESELILHGYHKNENLQIYYNGITGYISSKIFNELQKKKKTLKVEDIGLSYREFADPKLLQEQTKNLILNVHNIAHLENKIINLLTARGCEKSHISLLTKLNELLSEYDITVDKRYFVNDKTSVDIKGDVHEKKALILLQHLIGYKITHNYFEPIIVDSYNDVYFYDDEDLNIIACQNINKYLKNVLDKTQPWIVEKIKSKVKLKKLQLHLNKVTSNKVNPFEQQIITLTVD
jgi:hypothetical protein